ncbi:HAD family hydrolase [Pseudoponticoccus marisrubri]|uniref:CbbY/CbbZ/GpH/YieH n=1 Tax=Pseudoponticoccus marisrubri TaxID=1685382 RepID=A0A0W7WLX8_9RHOB|nr:HAD-IA family hydrolase [Pseudoponticoccus marisrubri]KUF11589.1 CbbY/CbbZ/GpH/YieH [Pseudoponticoccus marisrubri]
MTHALLFDLDGTLLQSDPLHFAVFRDMMAERGRAIDLAFYETHIHGRHNLDSFPELFPGEDAQALSELKERLFRERLEGGHPPMPGAPALLDRAEDAGWAVAVVTNAPRVNAEHMLAAIGLRARFDTLVIGDECARGKPDPAPYLAAMAALEVGPERCIAFEDSGSGLRAARAAGAYTVGLRSTGDDAGLRAEGAQVTIADFNDPALTEILRRFDREALT